MKPPPFSYIRAAHAAEAARAVRQAHENGLAACFLAGGQSLVPSLAFRQERPALLVDIMACSDLHGLKISNDAVTIGAACRQAAVMRWEAVPALLADALSWVAVPQVRTRSTLVGNLVQANPGGELPLVAMVLDAVFHTNEAGESSRSLAASKVYKAEGSALKIDELVTHVSMRRPGAHDHHGFVEIQLRPGHLPLVCAAALLSVLDGRITEAALAINGLNALPFRASRAEARLAGIATAEANVESIAREATAERPFPPRDDCHASGSYREAVAVVAMRKAIEAAVRRSQVSQE